MLPCLHCTHTYIHVRSLGTNSQRRLWKRKDREDANSKREEDKVIHESAATHLQGQVDQYAAENFKTSGNNRRLRMASQCMQRRKGQSKHKNWQMTMNDSRQQLEHERGKVSLLTATPCYLVCEFLLYPPLHIPLSSLILHIMIFTRTIQEKPLVHFPLVNTSSTVNMPKSDTDPLFWFDEEQVPSDSESKLSQPWRECELQARLSGPERNELEDILLDDVSNMAGLVMKEVSVEGQVTRRLTCTCH